MRERQEKIRIGISRALKRIVDGDIPENDWLAVMVACVRETAGEDVTMAEVVAEHDALEAVEHEMEMGVRVANIPAADFEDEGDGTSA